MFTYALAKGVRLGYLPKRYQANTEKAWQGILKKFIKKDATGLLTLNGTAKSVGLGGTPEQDSSYRYDGGEKVIANDSKGIGAFLLAASEMQMAPEATSGHSTHVIMDAWFNSQMRRNAAGQMASFHYKWNDLSNSGFSFFGHVFRSYGAETDTLYVAPTVENLKDANIYLIVSPDIPAKNPNPHYVQPVDVEAVVDWVRRGGVLVMMENDGPNAEFEHLNSLSERFGIHFNPVCRNRVQGKNFKMGKVPVAAGEPIFQNAHTFYMKEISTITPQKPAKSILIDKGDTLMATARFGKGTVFAVVDPWLYNEYTDGRKLPSEYDNYAGAQELASWLIAQSQHGTHRLPKGRSK
jgi:unsaturated rhamnogalacturonyl hydrolase